jgi:hypothetical protein
MRPEDLPVALLQALQAHEVLFRLYKSGLALLPGGRRGVILGRHMKRLRPRKSNAPAVRLVPNAFRVRQRGTSAFLQ